MTKWKENLIQRFMTEYDWSYSDAEIAANKVQEELWKFAKEIDEYLYAKDAERPKDYLLFKLLSKRGIEL